MSEEILTRWQDPTIDDLIKENLELKRKLGEADDAVEYWQIECDKRSKVLDKIKEYIEITKLIYDDDTCVMLCETWYGKEISKMIEEIN